LTIRDATAEDLTAISAIQTVSPQAAQWNPADYLAHRCRVALVDGRVAGYLAARRVAPDECEILNLAVDPVYRRRGVARALLAAELESAPGRWFLEVRASNNAAIQLYSSAGFELIGRRPDYYREPAEEGIVMRLFS
jgi:ribosomal-protein-alanine N-acetyltransferase